MDFLALLLKTLLLRPYVFLFLAAFLFAASRFMGWRRTGLFFAISWLTAFACEFSSTRTGLPFGWYFYTGSTVRQELYLSNVPFMDSLSFTFLLYASYCLALVFLLPSRPAEAAAHPLAARLTLVYDPATRTSRPVLGLTVLFFVFIDVVIDPLALRGDRWFLGPIYYYPEPGLYYGVTVANFVGWAVVGLIAMGAYFFYDRRLGPIPVRPDHPATGVLLFGCALYYGVLVFNLAMTFWIGELLLGLTGILIYLPITALLWLRLAGRLPAAVAPPLPRSPG